MRIIAHVIVLPKGLVPCLPQNRRCALCHQWGAHLHGTYPRYLPGACTWDGDRVVLVPRLLCLSCSKTFSLLPPFLVRRIGMPLPMLVFLARTRRKWDDLLDLLQIARNTLWSWKRLGMGLLEKIPELLNLPDVTWATLSLHLSRWQYPAGLRKPRPTIP